MPALGSSKVKVPAVLFGNQRTTLSKLWRHVDHQVAPVLADDAVANAEDETLEESRPSIAVLSEYVRRHFIRHEALWSNGVPSAPLIVGLTLGYYDVFGLPSSWFFSGCLGHPPPRLDGPPAHWQRHSAFA